MGLSVTAFLILQVPKMRRVVVGLIVIIDVGIAVVVEIGLGVVMIVVDWVERCSVFGITSSCVIITIPIEFHAYIGKIDYSVLRRREWEIISDETERTANQVLSSRVSLSLFRDRIRAVMEETGRFSLWRSLRWRKE